MNLYSIGVSALVCAVLIGCASPQVHNLDGPIQHPEFGKLFDYQIGGPYSPAKDVATVIRDRHAKPAVGAYNVCYINAFQTQPNDSDKRC